MVGLLLLTGSNRLPAQEPVDNAFVHWAFSAYFGTGWYRIRDDQSVFVVRFSPRWHWGEPGFEEDGRRSLGIEFRLPVTVGLHRLDADELTAILDVDNFGTATVTPGVEVEVPVTPRWSLKPLGYFGRGKELDGPQSAWIYWTGVKSRYRLGGEDSPISLVNSASYIGYTPNDGPSSDAVPLMGGLETRWPMGGLRLRGAPLYLDGHALYTAYLDDLDFQRGSLSDTGVSDEWELGLALSKGKEKLRFGFLEWDRIGLAYRFSSSGDLKAITLVFRSVFDR